MSEADGMRPGDPVRVIRTGELGLIYLILDPFWVRVQFNDPDSGVPGAWRYDDMPGDALIKVGRR